MNCLRQWFLNDGVYKMLLPYTTNELKKDLYTTYLSARNGHYYQVPSKLSSVSRQLFNAVLLRNFDYIIDHTEEFLP